MPPPSPIRSPAISSPPLRAALAAALVSLLLGTGAVAAPVDGTTALEPADPYELALRWTLAGLSPAAPTAPPAAPATLRPQYSALPRGAGDAGVPAPGAYALMGLGLLAAGLAASHLRRGRGARRGSSKKA